MSVQALEKRLPQQVGRYAIFEVLAAGGMATVHIARLLGREGFSRVVAAKRLHPHFLQDPQFKRMFLEEALLAARVRHPNVVPIVDVLTHEDELILVMEYVHGESLLALMRRSDIPCPIAIAASVMVGALQGLHAAHEACDERGEPLGIVHRDVSPHNILVGADGVARVVDFGVAKAVSEREDTKPGVLKGKFSYMAPEVLGAQPATRKSDVFSAAVVLWELLAARKLFNGATERERVLSIVQGNYPSVRQFNPRVSPALERVVNRGLELDPSARYETALAFAIDIEREIVLASQRVVGEWVQSRVADELERRAELIHEVETTAVVPITPGERASLLELGAFSAPPSALSAKPEKPSPPRFKAVLASLIALGAAASVLALTLLVERAPRQHSASLQPPAGRPSSAATYSVLSAPRPPAQAPPALPPAPSAAASATAEPAPTPTAPPVVAKEQSDAARGASPRAGNSTRPSQSTPSHAKHFLPTQL